MMKLFRYLQSVLIGVKTLIQLRCFKLLLSVSFILSAIYVNEKKDCQFFLEKTSNHLVVLVETELYFLNLSFKPSIELNVVKSIVENLNLKHLKILTEEDSLYTYLRLKYGSTYSDLVIKNICQQYSIERGD